MLDRNTCINNLKEAFNKLFDNKELSDRVCFELSQQNFSFSDAYKIVLLVTDLNQLSSEEIIQISETLKALCAEYFDNNLYNKVVLNCTGIEEDLYPISFKETIQISDEQYLSSIDAQILNDLYIKQIVYLDEDLNDFKWISPLSKKEIFIQKNTSEENIETISKLMREGIYVPQEVVLVPDKEAELFFIKDENTLMIKKGTFCLIDGVQNFTALQRNLKKDKDFSYPIILRIAKYSKNQIYNHIWQTKQRTPIIINTLTNDKITKNSNLVVDMLNENKNFIFYRQIKYKNGKFKYENMSELVNISFPVRKREQLSSVEKYICETFNSLVEKDDSIKNKRVSFRMLYIIIRGTGYGFQNKLSPIICADLVLKAVEEVDSLSLQKFSVRHVRKVCTRDVDRLIQEVAEGKDEFV